MISFNFSETLSKFETAFTQLSDAREVNPTVLQASDGQRFVMRNTERPQSIDSSPNNQPLVDFLSQRSQETKTFTLEQAKQALNL